ENFSGHANRSHCARPARVKGKVRDRLDHLILRYAVVATAGQVRPQLVRTVHCDQRADRDQATVALREPRARPYVSKQDLIGQLRELWRDIPEELMARRGLRCRAL